MTESDTYRTEVKHTFATLNKIYPFFETTQLAIFDGFVSAENFDFAKSYAEAVLKVFPELGYSMLYDLSTSSSSNDEQDAKTLQLVNTWIATVVPSSPHARRARAAIYAKQGKEEEAEKEEDEADKIEEEQEKAFKKMFNIETEKKLSDYFADDDEDEGFEVANELDD